MKNKKTYYLLILDKSGSMQDCVNETIGGFNEQLQMIDNLKKRFPEQEFYVSLTTFNDQVSHPFHRCSSNEIGMLNKKHYEPNGSTALLDAIGEGVMKLKSGIDAEIERDEASAVVVILTDGYENASRIFNWNGIRQMIRELEATSLWTFSFLGASKDAVEVASRMNIRRSNAMHYTTDKMEDTMKHVSYSLSNYAESKNMSKRPSNFLTDEEDDGKL